jgi:hypothetical protein
MNRQTYDERSMGPTLLGWELIEHAEALTLSAWKWRVGRKCLYVPRLGYGSEAGHRPEKMTKTSALWKCVHAYIKSFRRLISTLDLLLALAARISLGKIGLEREKQGNSRFYRI